MQRLTVWPSVLNENDTGGERAVGTQNDRNHDNIRLSLDIADLLQVIFQEHDDWHEDKVPVSERKGKRICASEYYPHIASRWRSDARDVGIDDEKLQEDSEGPEGLYAEGTPEERSEHEKIDASRMTTKEYLDFLSTTYPLPQMCRPWWWNALRYRVLSTYRILFIVILTTNLTVIFVVAYFSSSPPRILVAHFQFADKNPNAGSSAQSQNFSYPQTSTAVAANFFATVLLRHEHFVNLIFRPHCLCLIARLYPFANM